MKQPKVRAMYHDPVTYESLHGFIDEEIEQYFAYTRKLESELKALKELGVAAIDYINAYPDDNMYEKYQEALAKYIKVCDD